MGPPGVTARFAPYYTDFTCLVNAFVLTVLVTEHVGLPFIVLTLLAFLFSSSSFRVVPRHAVTRAFFSVCRFLRGSYVLVPCGSISAAAAVSLCRGSDPTSFAASCAGLYLQLLPSSSCFDWDLVPPVAVCLVGLFLFREGVV